MICVAGIHAILAGRWWIKLETIVGSTLWMLLFPRQAKREDWKMLSFRASHKRVVQFEICEGSEDCSGSSSRCWYCTWRTMIKDNNGDDVGYNRLIFVRLSSPWCWRFVDHISIEWSFKERDPKTGMQARQFDTRVIYQMSWPSIADQDIRGKRPKLLHEEGLAYL